MTATRHGIKTILGGLSAATLATGLAMAAPVAYAHDGGGGGGHGGSGGGDEHGHGHGLSHIDLPDGFQPEGIAIGKHHTAYLGSLVDGDILALDLRSGDSEVVSEGPGTPSVGLKVDHHMIFVAGGSAGDARIIDADSGDVLASYQLVPVGTPSFINDVILTHDAAWFTDSSDNALYMLPLGDDDDEGDDDGVGHMRFGSHARHGGDSHWTSGDSHGHHGHGGDHGTLPTQADVVKVDLTGAWVQAAGFNANGITTTPDGDALLVINSATGVLYRVETDGTATAVDLGGFVVTDGDGLLRKGDKLYAVQNQLNQVAVIELSDDGLTGELSETLTSPDLDVPTTIARDRGDLYLPNARFTTPPTPTTPYWVTALDD